MGKYDDDDSQCQSELNTTDRYSSDLLGKYDDDDDDQCHFELNTIDRYSSDLLGNDYDADGDDDYDDDDDGDENDKLTQLASTPTRSFRNTRWDISPRSKAKKIANCK